MKHHSHPAITARLKRAEGHLRAIIAMLEAERPCLDIAQQLHAVEAAVNKAKRTLIQDHVVHCIEGGVKAGETDAASLAAELREISKYL
jgi:uncharacterized protein